MVLSAICFVSLEGKRCGEADLPRFQLSEVTQHLHARITAWHREGISIIRNRIRQILELTGGDDAIAVWTYAIGAPLRALIVEEIRDIDLEASDHFAKPVRIVNACDRRPRGICVEVIIGGLQVLCGGDR